MFHQNRNAACGQYKEDILSQLREMVKSEPNSNREVVDAEPVINYQSLVPEQNVHPGHTCTGFAHDAEQIEFPAFGVIYLFCSYHAKYFLMLFHIGIFHVLSFLCTLVYHRSCC